MKIGTSPEMPSSQTETIPQEKHDQLSSLHTRRNVIVVVLVLAISFTAVGISFNNAIPSTYINTQLASDYSSQQAFDYCAPASVQMVLEYLKYSPIPAQTELATEMGTSSQGTNTQSIILALGNRNIPAATDTFGTKSFEAELSQIKDYLRQGFAVILCMWFDQTNSSIHSVVAYGYDPNGIYVNDPWNYQNNPPVGRAYGAGIHLTNQQLESLWSESNYFFIACK